MLSNMIFFFFYGWGMDALVSDALTHARYHGLGMDER